MKKSVAGEGSPPGPGSKHAGLEIFSYELPCGVVRGHTGQFPGYQAFGAVAPDGRAALAMMVDATDISKQADVAMVHAQQPATWRALGISATAGSTNWGGLVPSGGPPVLLAAVLAAAAVIIGASASSYVVLSERT